jgi:predicted DNA-binding transcriptional regulator AlpA
MAKPAKSRETEYPPRGMRVDRAAAYLDMSRSSFQRLVDEKLLPPGKPIKGMVVWDRRELDAAFEDLGHEERNTADVALGINTDGK